MNRLETQFSKLKKRKLYEMCLENNITTNYAAPMLISKKKYVDALAYEIPLPQKKRKLNHAIEERDFVKIMNDEISHKTFYHTTEREHLVRGQVELTKDIKVDAYSINNKTNKMELYQLKKGKQFIICNWLSDKKIKSGISEQKIDFKNIIECKLKEEPYMKILKKAIAKRRIKKNNPNLKISGLCLMLSTIKAKLSIDIERDKKLLEFITPNYKHIKIITYNKNCDNFVTAYKNKKSFESLENFYLNVRIIYEDSGKTNNYSVKKSYINIKNYLWYDDYMKQINL